MASDGTIKITTELDSTNAQKAMSKFGEVAQKGLSGLGIAAKAGAEAIATVSAGLVTAGGYAVKVGAEFEAGMSQVKAISGATAEEMVRLTEKAKEMGAKTKFSAAESADAFNYMAMAGWKTEEMLGGIEGIMNLAAASGEDLATTSDIVTDALTAFRLKASDSAHFADVLAQASSNANTNVAMMGETFKYVAPVAGTFGFNVEDTALAIGLMANSGIKASQAGTSLRGALTRLVKPTDDMQATMIKLGLAVEQVEHVIDSSKVDKMQGKVADKTATMQKAQISYNNAVAKYGENSAQAQKAAINLETAQRKLAEASGNLSAAQAGSNQVVGVQNLLLTDAEGNMKSFREVMVQLRESFKGMTEEQQAQAAATLFGQEAMSGMLAIINASDEDFNKLAESIDNSSGAAQRQAEIMQDNLQGALEELSGAADTLALNVYEKLEEPLKEATQKGTEYVNRISEAFTSGGLQEAVKEAGNIFGELATEAAKRAPDMVESSVEFIHAFVDGISDNKKELVGAAKDIVTVFIDGITEFLPKSVRKPVKDAIREISKSIESGGLKKASQTFVSLMEDINEVTGSLAKKAFPAFVKILDFTAEHVDVLSGAVAACVVAHEGMQIVDKTTTIIKTASAALETAASASKAYSEVMKVEGIVANASSTVHLLLASTMSKSELAIGVLTGRVEVATAAQVLWNAATTALTSPLGIVITAVAALAAGIAIYKLTTDEVVTAEEMQAERLQDISDKVSEQKTKWEELEQTKAEQLSADLSLMDHTQDLWKELQTLVDENGKVKKGYEDRASFITSQLNESLGLEIEMTDGVIQKYGELSQSIDSLMKKKRAQIILDGNEAQYSEALQNMREAEMNQAEAKRALDEQEIAVLEAKNAFLEAQNRLEKEAVGGNAGAAKRLNELRASWEEEKALLSERQTAYDESSQVLSGYYGTIADYENLAAAIASENATEMQEAIESITYSYQTATTANASELATQLLNQKEHIALLREALDAGAKGVTEDKIANAEAELAKMQEEYDKETANLDEHTKAVAGLMDKLTTDMSQDEAEQLAVWMAMVADAEVNRKKISDETLLMANTVIENFDKMPPQTREIMKNAMSPMMEEMQSAAPMLYDQAFSIADGICKRLKLAFDEHSPSKRTRKIFKYAMQGAELGMSDEENELYAQTESIADTVLDKFKNLDIGAVMQKIENSVFGLSNSIVPSSVREKTSFAKVAAESGSLYDIESDIDYGQMGNAMKKALDGVKVNIDGKAAGEILSPYADRNLGQEEKWKERL